MRACELPAPRCHHGGLELQNAGATTGISPALEEGGSRLPSTIATVLQVGRRDLRLARNNGLDQDYDHLQIGRWTSVVRGVGGGGSETWQIEGGGASGWQFVWKKEIAWRYTHLAVSAR